MRPRLPLALLASLGLPGVAAAQRGVGVGADNPDPVTQAVGGLLATLVVGALLLAFAPRYLDRSVEQAREDPLPAFGYGLALLIGFVGAVVVLAITVVGIVLVIPLVFVFVVAAVVGNVVGYVALLDGFVERRAVAVLAAAVAVGVVSLVPVLGDVVGFVVGAVGIGAMLLDYRD